MRDASAIWRAATAQTKGCARRLDLDVSHVTDIDGTVTSMLVAMRDSLIARGVRCDIVGGSGKVAELVHVFGGDRPVRPIAAIAPPRAIIRLGRATANALGHGRRLVEFWGEVALAVTRIVRHPRLGNWRALPGLVARAGTDGIPIVLLLNFLVGLVISYQSTRILRMYGANVFIADIVGISTTRELGPLITAIIMAGRSGAAYAAELGTMRVSEEIDALRTLGISPVPYLVVPRIWALALVAPILTLLGDIIGILGGLVVGIVSLDLTAAGFLAELRTAIFSNDVWTGLVKSVCFGAAIAFIGCQQGLSTRGAASGVGRSATTTVVQCLFALVVIDTLFTILFRAVNV